MTTLNSETIAKALKGPGLSPVQKILKAKEAWNDNTFFFPNKDEFLLSWICACFAKPNTKKIHDCCIFQVDYWKLLLELLEHYQKDNRRKIPFININLLGSVSLLLQEIYSSKSSIDTNQKNEFLAVTGNCLELLFSSSCSSSYRPSFENVSAVTDAIFVALEAQIILLQKQDEKEAMALEKLAFIAQLVLEKFGSQLILAANQKKVFFVLVEKSFCKLLSVRYQLKTIEDGKYLNISQQVTQIVCNGLFHPDMVLEYTSILKDATSANSASIKQTAYITKLFDVLENMVNNSNEKNQLQYSLDIMPVLLSAFLTAFRLKRNANTGAIQDINRKVEFGMFVHFLKIAKAAKAHSKSVHLEALSQLLKEVLLGNLYNARNDDVSKEQFSILEDISKMVVSYAKDEKNYNQGTVLEIFDTLLQIDLSLVEPCLQLLWPIMLNPVEKAEKSCIQFATSVLNAFTASRQIDSFVDDLIRHINKVEVDNVYDILKKPLFRNSFLNVFSSSVSKHLPAPQALGIFQLFSQNLTVRNNEPRDEKSNKRRKLATERDNCRFALTSAYLCSFISSLKLNSRQRQTFEGPLLALFDDFIKPCMNAWDVLNIHTSVIPAMQVHSTLTLAFYENYTQKIQVEDLIWIENLFVAIFQTIKDHDSHSAYIATVFCVNAMLQHVYYYVFLLQKRPLDEVTRIIDLIMDFISEYDDTKSWCTDTVWDGSILDIKGKNQAKVACWKLLTDEWFETIIQCFKNEQSKSFISIVYTTMKYEEDSTDLYITAPNLSKRLLRSANFYEAKCSKEWSIQIFLSRIIDLFKTKLSVECGDPVMITVVQMISSVNTKGMSAIDKTAMEALLSATQERSTAMQEDLVFNMNDICELVVLLKILLIFPSEYFEKSERTSLVYIASLIDIWCVENTHIDMSLRLKISLTCKNLNLQFIDFFSTNSIFGSNPRILAWLITSSHQLAIGGTETCKNTSAALRKLSDELEKDILRKILASAGTKSPDSHATQYLTSTVERCETSVSQYIAFGLPTESVNLLDSLISFLNTRKVPADADMSNIIYATDMITTVNCRVIESLNDTKTTIVSILKQMKNNDQNTQMDLALQYTKNFECAKRALYLTRLLHGYARALGSDANKALSMKELSRSLMDLASPLIQLLQTTLHNSTNSTVCNLATEFIAALCSMPIDNQHVKASKHILATFWFIYSLMHNMGDTASVELLSDTFALWIKNSSREQLDFLITGFIEKAEEQAAKRDSTEKENHNLIFIKLLSLLFIASTDYQKAKLKRQIPVFIIKITLIAEKAVSLDFLQMMLKLLVQLTVDESYRLSSFDLSLVLSCLVQVARPDAQRLKSQINQQSAHHIFTDICHILSNIMRHYKEQIIDVMPPFIAITQSLLHCFKSGHVSLVNGLNAKKRKAESKSVPRTIALLSDFAPLNNVAAQQYSRLLTTIPQKQHSYIVGKTNRNSQSVIKAISKHTPSILIEYFTIQSNSTMSILQPSIKSALTNALYGILDLCSDDDRSFVMACLDAPGKLLFKEFYSNWKENHKYSGQ